MNADEARRTLRRMALRLTEVDIAFDTHVLVYFARGGLLSFMRQVFSGRLHIAEAVRWETHRAWEKTKLNSIRRIFFSPTWFEVHDTVEEDELTLVQNLQRDWEAKYELPYDPWFNLGEAESLVICRREHWPFVSNDRAAVEMPEDFGVKVWSPAWVLFAFVAKGLLTPDEAWARYEHMHDSEGMGEWLRFPLDERDEFMKLARVVAPDA